MPNNRHATHTSTPREKPTSVHTHTQAQRMHKCQSQPAISLWTGGTLPPHHLRVLFITVWQHVSSSPCHCATLHWYSPTVQQPGMQHGHANYVTLEEELSCIYFAYTHIHMHIPRKWTCVQTCQFCPMYKHKHVAATTQTQWCVYFCHQMLQITCSQTSKAQWQCIFFASFGVSGLFESVP